MKYCDFFFPFVEIIHTHLRLKNEHQPPPFVKVYLTHAVTLLTYCFLNECKASVREGHRPEC